MAAYWLNMFFRFSGYTFKIKQKIIKAEHWAIAVPYAVYYLVLELGFVVISLPVYLLVPPAKVQEEGFIFPKSAKESDHVKTYLARRKISLMTLLISGGIFLIKVLFIGIVSFYLFGLQPLLADTQDWTFDTAGNYTYDSGKIEVVGGVAQLKNLGGSASGGTTNYTFDSNSIGWTGVPTWLVAPSKVNSTNWQAAGGNTLGYVDINLPGKKGNSSGAYWYQAFTTSVDAPDSATLTLDWKAFTVTGSPTSYNLYAFIGTDSGNPTIGSGNQVWDSGNITGATSWASVSVIDILSKVPTSGTYYLKIAAYHTCSMGTDCSTVGGFDNVAVNWSKSVISYDTSRPTVYPNTSLNPAKVITWNSFTETATKNGGEIYYQLSDDDGATWNYWNGSVWASAGASNYNTADIVNTNIGTFPTTNNKVKWQAFLESNGSQQVILDNIAIGYTQNALPVVANLAPEQNTTAGYVYVNYDLQDENSDPSSLVTYEYSLTGAFAGEQATMTAVPADPNHSGINGLTSSPAGVTHTFVWDAMSQLGAIYNAGVYVRLRANDGIGNGDYTISSAFTVDYVLPVVSNVSALQTVGTTNVVFTYDLSDDTSDSLFVELDVSDDGGSTWNIADSAVSGAVGSGVSTGTNKTITWDAKTDFNSQIQNDLQVRVRAKDKWQNQGADVASASFSLDTTNPATNVSANLQAQPNAGDTTVLIGGSFTETNPNTNDFYVEINGGGYSDVSVGDTDTATPSNKATAVGATLDGNDYISKVKITHIDDYGQSVENENVAPAVAYKYVKPYTPQAPILSGPLTTQLNVTINPHASEASDVEYAINETTTGNYVQTDGTLGVSPVWHTTAQWGSKTVIGLTSPVANYIFKVKSRNPSDAGHASSSESAFSSTSQISNTAPSISHNIAEQTIDGTQYVTINYTGTDGQGDLNDLYVYEYSADNSSWSASTEKSGVGSDGISSLVFLPSGSVHNYMWDSGVDLINVEDDTVYFRLRSTDSLANSTLATTSAFKIDNKAPVVSNVAATQNVDARTVAISYDLTENNTSTVEIAVSDDGGSTWSVVTSAATGAVGAGVAPGAGKSITWNAGIDFDNQYQTDMQVKVRALDSYGNQGAFAASSNFTVDTHDPVVSNVTAVQDSEADTFTFNYDVSEDAGNVNVVLAVSADGGSTWNVPITSATGDIGSVVAGTNKTITWNGFTDYSNQEKLNMQIRITGTDGFSNSHALASANFSLDTYAPRVTSVVASQTAGTTNVSITYSLADQNNSLVEIDISEDGGSTWTVVDSAVTGDVGTGIGAGSKTITWAAGTDFDEEEQSDMRVQVRAKDLYNHQGADVESSNFVLDTLNPANNVLSDLLAQPNAGDTMVLIGGSFVETNPNTNNFYVAINGGAYSSATSGSTNTASPSNQNTAVGATLDGNDYISKVQITHVDDFGQSYNNENLTPTLASVYVKPYTPQAPTVDNPTVGTVDVLINPHTSEIAGLEYAIWETSQSKYVQANGTLGVSVVWQQLGTGSGQWGYGTGFSGKVNVNGLSTDSYLYQFQVKSRNTSDGANAASSESALSSGASSTNQSPDISLGSITQTTDGSKYVTINYTGTDLESENVDLIAYQYSTNNSNWFAMTEKAGVGSDGTTGLVFAAGGTAHDFMWDVGTDLANTEDSTVYVRLQGNDGTSDGGVSASSAFTIDTKNPVISAVAGAQTLGSNNVVLSYTLTDLSTSSVELDVSDDSGASWNVTDISLTGDIGSVSPGAGKSVTWNAGVDFDNQEQADLQVRFRALDAYGNQGDYAQSTDFTVDTKNPAVSNVLASQDSGLNTVTITYDLSDANNSTVEIDISDDGGSNWNVTDTSLTGAVGGDVPPGAGKTIVWNAGADFSGQDQADIRVRVRAEDPYANNSGDVWSANFSLDTLAPAITNVQASQTLGSTDVSITYNLVDSDAVNIALDISDDSGFSWTVTDASVTGAVGVGVTQGSGKTITWAAGTDFDEQEQADLRVRIRGTDSFNNTSNNVESIDFALDTLNPTVNAGANLKAQPNAGDTTILIGGSFIESNPNTNLFYAAINDGAYAAGDSGDTNTATPADRATTVDVTLDGNDYISKVKVVHSDDYGQAVTNENLSPSTIYKYVKPYIPSTPTVNNPQNSSVDVVVNAHASEAENVQYAIYENSTGKYVQAGGTLNTSAVWQTAATWGTVSVTGLTSPVANYSFKTKSRNPSDSAHDVSSESEFSNSAAISNIAPSIVIDSVNQESSGNYVMIDYTGTDAQSDSNNLIALEYSTDNSNWFTMTEKAGVGSDGTADLIFTSSGAPFVFAWDVSTDLPNQEQATVYVRLQSTDTLATSNLATSSSFYTDTLGPVISGIATSQTPGSNVVTIEYDLADSAGANNNVEIEISSDSGSTWDVPTTTLMGDVGAGVMAGVDRSVTWNAGTDFNNQESSTMQVRIRATDQYGNLGSFSSSSDFTVDTKVPVVSAVTASQVEGSNNITINYDLADNTAAGHLVEFSVSDNGGSTWVVTAVTASGDVGSGQTTGSKTFIWYAGTDFLNQAESDMQVRVRSTDYFGHVGDYASSSNFVLDTSDPVVSSVVATQTGGGGSVEITYNLADDTSSDLVVAVDISDNGGSTWVVATSTLAGAVGGAQSVGSGKTITWDASSDYPGQYNSVMQVRVRATDKWSNAGVNVASPNFTVDTKSPIVSNVIAAQTAASSEVVIHYDLADDTATDLAVAIDISSDNGATWTVATSTLVGDVGASQEVGINKTVTWDASTDFSNEYNTAMKVRVRAIDSYNNFASTEQLTAFTVDTITPTVTNVTAVQTEGTTNFIINYDLADNTSSGLTVAADISADNGSTWTVATTTLSGAVGPAQTTGSGKIINWAAGTDYDNQYKTQMKVRVRATDNYNNSSINVESSAFVLDTKNPVISNVGAVQNSGSNNVIISYDLAEDTTDIEVSLEVSNNSGATWTVTATTLTGDVGSGQTAGTDKSITWDVDTDYDNQFDNDMKVRLLAIDAFNNESSYAQSADFTVDTSNPAVSNVSAGQTLGTDSVTINYDLADDSSSDLEVVLEISSNSGSTWVVPTTSATGAIGVGQTVGTNKTITWDAGTDFDGQFNATMQVRIKAMDKFTNWGAYDVSSDFAVDAKDPVILTTADLKAQPQAGDTTVLIGGSFTENNPNTNNFYLGIDGADYGSLTSGESNTATPIDQNVDAEVILKGNNYISKVKIVHTDDYGQVIENENTTPAITYKYVKPYTPTAPTVNNPTTNSIDVTVNKNSSEVTGLEYAIYENTTGKYVQSDGSLNSNEVWQTRVVWGTITVTGLNSPVSAYAFQTKSINSADTAYAASSESSLSSAVSFGNNAPVISITSVVQNAGMDYVTIDYVGTDNEEDSVDLVIYEYSLDNSSWSSMTEKSGVGSSGIADLAFTSGGADFNFVWDAGADLSNVEDSSVYVRLRGNDGVANGNLAQSSSFALDLKAPVISNIDVSQQVESSNVVLTYNLADLTSSNITITAEISADNGSTWNVATTSLSGAVGGSQTTGVGQTISWDAGIDFDDQYNAQVKFRISAQDSFNNLGDNVSSLAFSVDTQDPVVSNVSAVQTAGTNNVTISYDLADANDSTVAIDISDDGGANWTVPDTTVSGAVGVGVTSGTGKTITWNAGTDFGGEAESDMRVRVRATDAYNNFSGNSSSSNFEIDTAEATITNLAVSQLAGSTNVIVSYDLADSNNSNISLDISDDGGSTWDVTDLSVNGSVGSGVSPGIGKSITWNAAVDFDNQYQTDMKVRLSSTDFYGNTTVYVQSANFILDTANPVVGNVSAVQTVGTKNVLITYDLADNNVSTVEIDISENGGSTWAVTDTSVVGAVGPNVASGLSKSITWNAGADFNNQAQSDLRIRVRATDNFSNQGDYSLSDNFVLDTSAPTVANLIASQANGSNTVVISYDLADTNNSTVEIDISDDAGLTWAVVDSSVTGSVGLGVTPGTNKIINWDAGADFNGQAQADIRVRVRATDIYGNFSGNVSSADFSVDTAAPVINNITVSQLFSSGVVVINYTLTEYSVINNFVEFEVSNDNGATWTVATTTATGAIGANQSAGVKSLSWNPRIDYDGHFDLDMKVRLSARDTYNNQGSFSASEGFSVDTQIPVLNNVSAAQLPGTKNVLINYDLVESSDYATVVLEISNNSGSTWTVSDESVTGQIGLVSSGFAKTITWAAGTDFNNQEQPDMRVRLKATDDFGNESIFFSSGDFVVDTAAPVGIESLIKFASSETSVTLNWTATTDANFDYYELWHGANEADVNNRTGIATRWSVSEDANLSDPTTISTVVTSFDLTDDYFVKIWAIDSFGNESTADVINVSAVTVPVVVASGEARLVFDATPPIKPILRTLITPTNEPSVIISGLAEPGTSIELYDEDVLIAVFDSAVNDSGEFTQSFTFEIGHHSLTTKAIDASGNVSPASDPIILDIITALPVAPIILLPYDNSEITNATPEIVGLAQADSDIIISIDENKFIVRSDYRGAWNFVVPSVFALDDGLHLIAVVARDAANNESESTTITINKITLSVPVVPISEPIVSQPVTAPVEGGVISQPGTLPVEVGFISQPIVLPVGAETVVAQPVAPLVREITRAIELPGIPVPKIITAGAVVLTEGDILSFSGTSLPNSDVVVYIHSDQALIYRTRTDQLGNWAINHSQVAAELAPGDHTIYAMALDANANVKSRPSPVSSFTVERNFWVMVFRYLNWQTTVVTLVALIIALAWLYHVRDKRMA